MKIAAEENDTCSIENVNSVKISKKNFLERSNHKIEKIKDLFKNDIRTEIYELIIKIFFTPHHILKIYLFLVSIVSIGLASYMLAQSILSYLNFGVITTSRTIFEVPTTFPKVTICNSKMFTTQYAYNFLKQANDEFFPEIDIMNSTQMKIFDGYDQFDIITSISFFANQIITGRNFSDDNRFKLSHNFEDILISCRFNYQKCTSNDFQRIFDSYYGNCYVFNSGLNSSGNKIELKQTKEAGMLFGLQLKLYVNFNENLTRYNAYDDVGYGALIRIDNSSYSTDHNFDGIKVSPGQLTDIKINREFKYTLPKPYSDCEIEEDSPKITDYELYNLIANSSYQYTQDLCFQQCFQKLIIEKYNCSVGLIKSFFDYKTCSAPIEIECMFDLFSNKYTGSSFIKDQCVPLCPLQCYVKEYNIRSSSYSIIPNLFADYINNNKNLSEDFSTKPINEEIASKSIVIVNIFYDSLSYTLTTETPQMDFVSLLANIGGNMGLFLGVSLLSLCELFEILIEIVFCFKNN